MVDRRGNAYADLKSAFQYRTRFDKSCQCRPEPWSKEARERHALYATKDWQKQSRRLARLEQRRARRNRRLPETGYQPSSTLFGATPQGGYLPGVAGWQQQPGTGPDMVNSQPRMALGNRPRSVKRRRSRQPRSIRRSRKQWRTNAFSSQN